MSRVSMSSLGAVVAGFVFASAVWAHDVESPSVDATVSAQFLIMAIRNEDRHEVARLLAGGADPNAAPADNGRGSVAVNVMLPPLFEAVAVGDEAIIAALAEAGAGLDAIQQIRDREFHTPLSLAAQLGQEQAALALINQGADPAGPVCGTNYCGNALTLAAARGDVAMIRALVAGRSVEAVAELLSLRRLRALRAGMATRSGETRYGSVEYNLLYRVFRLFDPPLLTAARHGDLETFEALYRLGADIDQQLANYESPLSIARKHGNRDIIAFIEEQGAKAVAFVSAVKDGDVRRVTLLIAAGHNVNTAEPNGLTPLVAAVDTLNDPMVSLLLSAGADPDKGAPIHQFWYDVRPIHVAVKRGHIGLVRQLLQAGADPNVTYHGDMDEFKNTTLDDAIVGGDIEIVRALIAGGADPKGPADMGHRCTSYTYLELAASLGNMPLVHLLAAEGNVINPPRGHLWPSDGFIGTSPLIAAACGGHADMVAVLLNEYRADPLTKNNVGCSAVDYAINRNNDEAARILLAAGSVPSGTNCQFHSRSSL